MAYRLDIPGWMSEHDLQFLETLAGRVPDGGRIVEIGSFCGRSAWTLAQSARSARVRCVDPWDGNMIPAESLAALSFADPGVTTYDLRHFLHYTSDCPNITYTQDASRHVLPTLRNQAMIFLDGVHTLPGFDDDMLQGFAALRDGGMLCGHDFQIKFPDIITTVRQFAANHRRPVWFGHQSTIWMIEKS